MKEYSIEDFKTLLKYDDIKSELCKIKCKNCTKTFGEHQGMRCGSRKSDTFVPDYRKKKIKEKKK